MTENPVLGLWTRHAPRASYPSGVVGVPEPIRGTAFFPGGYGLWGVEKARPLPAFPVGGVMVLGHDFHSEQGYYESVRRGRESLNQPTWRNLISVLKRADIPPERCFFTNFYMGLRAGSATTGRFPGARDAAFVAHCRSFLLDQLRMQRPTVVLTLGVHTPHAIAPLSAQLADWGIRRGLKHLDRVGPVRQGVQFGEVPGVVATVVALTHPSLRHASVRHRRYGSLAGDDAELEMITAAGAAACAAASAATAGGT